MVGAASIVFKDKTIAVCQCSCVYSSLCCGAKRQSSNCILNSGVMTIIFFFPVSGKCQNFCCLGRCWHEECVRLLDAYWFEEVM